MELASIPRELPQFGRHLSSLTRPASEVFGQQGSRKGKESYGCGGDSCGCGGGTGSCGCGGGKGSSGCDGNNLPHQPAWPDLAHDGGGSDIGDGGGGDGMGYPPPPPEEDCCTGFNGRAGFSACGEVVPCPAPPAGMPKACADSRKCIKTPGGAVVECVSFCTVGGVKIYGIQCDGGIWPAGGGGGWQKCSTTQSPPKPEPPCNNGCSTTIYADPNTIPKKHQQIVLNALERRVNAPVPVLSLFESDNNRPVLRVGPQKNSRWWQEGKPAGLGFAETEMEGFGVVAVLEYTCACGPSALLDWFMESRLIGAGAGGGPVSVWHQDPEIGYDAYLNAITVTGQGEGNDADKCFVALSDTPGKDAGLWLAMGRVKWARPAPLECTSYAVFERKNQTTGRVRPMAVKAMDGKSQRFHKEVPFTTTGRVHGSGS
jgi:hypothetical protein